MIISMVTLTTTLVTKSHDPLRRAPGGFDTCSKDQETW